ncbi:sensor histidine kinase, partial [Kineococcus glutinatus]|uniref:sensor histidine kinase n=1 Tax=Kineococcus glutinatus TaxID=1070872 RepID=UPI003CD0772A
GTELTGEVAADGPDVPVSVGLTAYRLVQEGLTNAQRHAPGAAVLVRVARRGAQLVVEVGNGPSAGAAAVHDGAPGTGLLGLRERVAAVGGELVAGPDGGGHLLRAVLPLGAAR